MANSLLHWHRWSDWAVVETGTVHHPYTTAQIGNYLRQERFCTTCGKHQIHQQRSGSMMSDVRLVPATRQARAPSKDRV